MEKRYGALRFIGTVYKVLGVIVGVVTILSVIGLCLASVAGGAALSNLGQYGRDLGAAGAIGGAVYGVVLGIFGIIYGGGLAVSLYGLGEGVYLAISIEENTRATVRLLEQQSKPEQTPGV
jgi:hypothetical protein